MIFENPLFQDKSILGPDGDNESCPCSTTFYKGSYTKSFHNHRICPYAICWGLRTRPKVKACTSKAPALRRVFVHAFRVAPVVNTSSTRTIVLPARRPF